MGVATWTMGVLVLCSGAGLAAQGKAAAKPEQEKKQERADEAASVRKALASALLKAEVERDLQGALAALEPLRVRATEIADARARGNLVVEVAASRAKLLAELGRTDEALAATRELAPKGAALGTAELERLAGDPRLEAVRSKLSPAKGAEEPAIESTVRRAVNEGNGNFLQEIGARAAPVLEAMTLESIEQFPNAAGQDSLVHLFAVAERRGARFVLEHFGDGGFFWKKRIVRAMRAGHVLTNEGTWSGNPPKPQVLREPEWLKVLELLLRDPLSRRDAAQLSAEIVDRDAVTPELAEGLVDALFSGDPDTERDVVAALDQAWDRTTAIGVLEAALDHGDLHVRRIAAERLAGFPYSARLRAASGDPDAGVRMQVALSLQPHTRPRARREQQYVAEAWVSVKPTLRPDDEGVLSKLLSDEDAAIATKALDAFLAEPSFTPPVPLLLELARVGSLEARARLTRVESIGRQDLARLLEILAVDPAREVRDAVDRRLERLCEEDPIPYLAVVRARLPLLPGDQDPGRIMPGPMYPGRAVQSPEGARTLLHDALRQGDDRLVVRLFRYLDKPREPLRWLADEDLELLVRKAEGLGVLPNLREDMAHWDRLPVSVLLKVLRDQTVGRPTRAVAASLIARVHEPEIDEALIGFLTEDSWSRTPPGGEERESLQALKTRSYRDDWTSPVLLAAIRSPALHDHVLEALLYDGTSRALAPDVLTRMAGKSWDPVFWQNELGLLEGPLSSSMVELLVDLLEEPQIASDVARTMGRLMQTAFVAPLGALVLGPDGPDGEAKAAAIEALGAYLDDRTAEILLIGVARTSDEGIREACFQKLETIRRYQDERARWEARASDTAARDRTVRDLVAMLGDATPAVRGQAARSLATLRAVEALPKIVALLKDSDAKVREAANEALRMLNSPEPVEQPEKPEAERKNP